MNLRRVIGFASIALALVATPARASGEPSCGSARFEECAEAGVSMCGSCPTGVCTCEYAPCAGDGGLVSDQRSCIDLPACDTVQASTSTTCRRDGESCTEQAPYGTHTGPATGTCRYRVTQRCRGEDGGATTTPVLICGDFNQPNYPSSSSSSSSSGGSSSKTTDPKDASGCATSSSTSLPVLAAPLAIGLLFALRRRQPKNAPSARKRS